MILKIDWRSRLMIAVLAVTAFAPTLKTGFMWDDHVMIEANPTLRSWTPENIKHDFTSDVFDGHGDPYYRPLQTVANRIDFSVWGLRAVGFHLTNLLFHIGNALLVAELVLALGFLPLTALMTGTLFAVHPIIVEQLMIIAGRAELMGLFFLLAALLLLLRNDRRSIALGALAYLGALFCKESTLILPALLALAYYVRREPGFKYKRLIPMALLLIPYMVLRQSIVGPIIKEPDYWLTVRFFSQEFPSVIVKYISLVIFPWNLHSHRLLPHISYFWTLYLLGVVGLASVSIKKWGRPAIFCVGWFILTLLPKTPIMIYGNFMLDHWAYPAAIAVFLPLALLFHRAWNARREWVRSLAGSGYFGALILWALLAHLNVALRGTDESMYRWALRFTSSNPVKYNLGVLLLETGRAKEAVDYLQAVRANYPNDPNNTRVLALAYWFSGHKGAGLKLMETGVKQYPQNPELRQTLDHMRLQFKPK